MPFVAEVGDAVQTHGEVTFEWKICDFSSLSHKMGDYYLSPVFSFANIQWCLQLFPNGSANDSSGWLGLFLKRKETGPPITVNYVLGIKGSDVKRVLEREFLKEHDDWGIFKFLSRSDLKNQKSTLVPNNVLTVTCDLRNNILSTDNGASSNSVQKIIHSMKAIRAEGKRSDFTLKLGSREWPVHKMILESRCEYFENMFRHEWVENTVAEVKFEDIEEEALDGILDFIYTGSVERMCAKNVCEIYTAAHKFLLDDLKAICIEWMKTYMCLEIVCKALVIADTYEERDLNESAIEYFIRESCKILDSEEWKELKKNHVSIVIDVLEETTKREGKKRTEK